MIEVITSTRIDISNKVDDIQNILHEDLKVKDYFNTEFQIITNINMSKQAEVIEIKEKDKNITYKIICFAKNDISNNILKDVIDLDESQFNKKYKILKDIILKYLKRKYEGKLNKYKNSIISIGIHMGNNNCLRIVINVEKIES
jgi:hypothetical protein